jgi:hypothetical protein
MLPMETIPTTTRARTTSLLGLAMLLFSCSPTLPPASLATAGPTTAAAIPTVHAPCEDGQAWQEALGTLPATAVQHVEPTYLRDTCAGTTLVSGTKLAVVPDAVQSAQWARLLECRTARVRFAKVPASVERASRPWTPEGWVDIAVEHDPKSLILTLHAESAAKNIQLFHTTLAFLGTTRN